MDPLLLIGATAAASALPVLWWALSGPRPEAEAKAVLNAGLQPVTDFRQALLAHSAAERAVGPAVSRLATSARRLTPAGLTDSLERRIFLAGAPAAWPMERVLAAKLVLGGVGLLIGLLRVLGAPSALGMLLVAGMAGAGFFLPDLLLSNSAGKRQKHIGQNLPDTLDQVTISVEAGLGFEAAVARAARAGDTPLAQELQRVLQDIQAGVSRQEAFRGLVARTDVPPLRQFVAAMLQAESYGIPIATVLRVQAAELRVKRRQAAEERAMKLPVKVIFPLILCILPTIFIVVIGPAVISVSRDLVGNL